MKKEATMILTNNMCKVIYIQPRKKEIGEYSTAIGDTAEFSRFCNTTGLSWLFRYFYSMSKLAECMGEYISKGSNDYLNSAISKIADWMGESKPEIKKYLSTMVMMDEYLNYLEYDGIYTQLDGREDQFLSLTKWLDNFYGENSKRA